MHRNPELVLDCCAHPQQVGDFNRPLIPRPVAFDLADTPIDLTNAPDAIIMSSVMSEHVDEAYVESEAYSPTGSG